MSSADEQEEQMSVEEENEEFEEEEDTIEESKEVYVVEKVVNHRKRGGKTQYFLKWKGYPEEDNTWEDEDNLFCHELIEAYLKNKESAKNTPGTKNSRGKSAKRAKTDSSDEEEASPIKKNIKEEDLENWEDQVQEVETVERDESNTLKVYLIWNNGKRTVHDAEDANQRCPQKVIKFYEAHLRFKAAS
ncbi:Chromobox protein 3, variant 2 [Basidiobolus ranarum]|uniref:Chromobox protein 3, variant 2 n=1 Tax=Basidiobolus ranarum TaxID=34480 RepID=A0ABR2WFB1_9FUNG